MLLMPELSADEREDEARLTQWGGQLKRCSTPNSRPAAPIAWHCRRVRRRTSWARTEHGVTVEKHLHREFFNSSEYRRIAELSAQLAGLFGAGRT